MKLRIIAFSLLVSVSGVADDCASIEVAPDVTTELAKMSKALNTQCPNQVNIADLCVAVSDKVNQPNSTFKTKFAYQNLVYRASCVEPSDTPETVKSKVQVFWNRFHAQINCSQLGFSVKEGNILKLAVERDSQEFVEEALLDWQVSLNHVDKTDKKTVLDYIEENLKLAKGTSKEKFLKTYFDLFRENGAKFSREL